MAATNYVTKIYNVTRGGENVEFDVVVSATGSSNTSAVFIIGPLHYHVNGTFAGATAILQAQRPDSSWADMQGTTATEAADKLVDWPPHMKNTVRVRVADSSTTTELQVWLQAGSGADVYD